MLKYCLIFPPKCVVRAYFFPQNVSFALIFSPWKKARPFPLNQKKTPDIFTFETAKHEDKDN